MISRPLVNPGHVGMEGQSRRSSEFSFTCCRSTPGTLVTSTSSSSWQVAPLVSSRVTWRRALLTLSVSVALSAPFLSVPSAHATGPSSPIAAVWTEPHAGYGFLDAAIEGAHRSIDVSMYELSDSTIERYLVAKARAGVSVRVLLNSDYDG